MHVFCTQLVSVSVYTLSLGYIDTYIDVCVCAKSIFHVLFNRLDILACTWIWTFPKVFFYFWQATWSSMISFYSWMSSNLWPVFACRSVILGVQWVWHSCCYQTDHGCDTWFSVSGDIPIWWKRYVLHVYRLCGASVQRVGSSGELKGNFLCLGRSWAMDREAVCVRSSIIIYLLLWMRLSL